MAFPGLPGPEHTCFFRELVFPRFGAVAVSNTRKQRVPYAELGERFSCTHTHPHTHTPPHFNVCIVLRTPTLCRGQEELGENAVYAGAKFRQPLGAPRKVVVVGWGPVGHATVEMLLEGAKEPLAITILCEAPLVCQGGVRGKVGGFNLTVMQRSRRKLPGSPGEQTGQFAPTRHTPLQSWGSLSDSGNFGV